MSTSVISRNGGSRRRTLSRASIVVGILLAVGGLAVAISAWEHAQVSVNSLDIRRMLEEEHGVYPNDYALVWIWLGVALVGIALVVVGTIRAKARTNS